MKFNDITREFLEDFISKLPSEDKKKLKEYIANNPRTTSSSTFTLVKSYVYNTYFKTTPTPERRKETFAEVLDSLLEDEEEDDNF
jgi:hypothetical protein